MSFFPTTETKQHPTLAQHGRDGGACHGHLITVPSRAPPEGATDIHKGFEAETLIDGQLIWRDQLLEEVLCHYLTARVTRTSREDAPSPFLNLIDDGGEEGEKTRGGKRGRGAMSEEGSSRTSLQVVFTLGSGPWLPVAQLFDSLLLLPELLVLLLPLKSCYHHNLPISMLHLLLAPPPPPSNSPF